MFGLEGKKLYLSKVKISKGRKVKISILLIQGLVQGVGFRPFIYRIAKEMHLRGEVENRNNGVCIRAFLSPLEKEVFIRRIYRECPQVATIHRMLEWEEEREDDVFLRSEAGFFITSSRSGSDEITLVSPDIAVCPACMEDRRRQPHRRQYPFVNCTHCGPRFSIVQDLPYDRRYTTMAAFEMCPDCGAEYTDVTDRRFHAQPVACNHCGPFYYATYRGRRMMDYETLLSLSCQLLRQGQVIAVKGIGGYHLVCDALNEEAVGRLREIKRRETKPFAVMFRDVESVEKYVYMEETEKNCLHSWRRPIVLLKQRAILEGESVPLAEAVHPGMQTVGCLLPYMPVHYDWFARLDTPALVMTSGNRSDLPIQIRPEEAEEEWAEEVALILHHNREIYNRVDDSVLQVCGSQPCLLRRSRGYVPEPFFADTSVEGLLAFGAEKVSTFALGKGDMILQSQYIGDLKNWETFRFYIESLERFQHLFRFTPRLLVCDLHPDYLSSQEAERISRAFSLPLQKVQHHHAHAAACLLEYGLTEPVVALIMDGTGLGDDGKSWGGEFLLCDRSQYRRLGHLEYVVLPGGDKASTEPWRMALSYLVQYGLPLPADWVERIGKGRVEMVQRLIEKGIQCPFTSSAGRLFDAVASLLGICDVSTRQAEAAVGLEQAAERATEGGEAAEASVVLQTAHIAGITNSGVGTEAEGGIDIGMITDAAEVTDTGMITDAAEKDPLVWEEAYPFSLPEGEIVSVRFLLQAILEDRERGVSSSRISARFHATLARLLWEKAREYMRLTGVRKVVVSGGCFQNKRLTETLQRAFASCGIPLYVPSRIPCNDSGIAIGQLAIAAACVLPE